jgi:hypothetical protein
LKCNYYYTRRDGFICEKLSVVCRCWLKCNWYYYNKDVSLATKKMLGARRAVAYRLVPSCAYACLSISEEAHIICRLSGKYKGENEKKKHREYSCAITPVQLNAKAHYTSSYQECISSQWMAALHVSTQMPTTDMLPFFLFSQLKARKAWNLSPPSTPQQSSCSILPILLQLHFSLPILLLSLRLSTA